MPLIHGQALVSETSGIPLHDIKNKEWVPIPIPSHRHAAPSAPWPWIDIHDELEQQQLESSEAMIPSVCPHTSCDNCWKEYPKSLFPNWTPSQVSRSKIKAAVARGNKCTIHRINIGSTGCFSDEGVHTVSEESTSEFWATLLEAKSDKDRLVRALFIDDLSGPVLRMLGTAYNVEPFFWSSSLNWIPSRFQEDPRQAGDHVTITLQFLKSIAGSSSSTTCQKPDHPKINSMPQAVKPQSINTRAPLDIKPGGVPRQLVLDLLSVHLVRRNGNSTLISYHANMNHTTKASYLHDRIQFSGQSVYWQKIFKNTTDPTFVLLLFIWHAVYAWDEALQHLYEHICLLENKVMEIYNKQYTRELYSIRAHQLHYFSLIDDMNKSVEFIAKTKNPAMDLSPELKRECENLLDRIRRLEQERSMQDQRLKNLMDLVFSSVNIDDSKQMQEMTGAAVKDSAGCSMSLGLLQISYTNVFFFFDSGKEQIAFYYNLFDCSPQMKQIAYLTMIFLPASFVAGIFGMNVHQIAGNNVNGTLAHYFAVAIPLTVTTIWAIVAFQIHHIHPPLQSWFDRLLWPVTLPWNLMTSSQSERLPV